MLEDTDKIGISMSGGLDSTILTWLLCKEIFDNNKNTVVYPLHGIDNTRPTSPENVQNIINFLRKYFPTVEIKDMSTWDNTKGFVGDNGVNKKEKDRNGLKKWCVEYGIKYLYQGRTANPPKEVLDEFGGYHDEIRSHKNDKLVMVHTVKTNISLIRPWANVDKKFIYEQYKKHNLLDTLVPLTWSCISYADKTNFFTEPCKECFWCKEKHWGFGRY